MKKNYYDRPIILASYILENKCTIRETAKVFGISKSTVHNDVSNRLKNINFIMFKNVKKILKYNFEDKHIRGGNMTKEKYKKIKLNSKKI